MPPAGHAPTYSVVVPVYQSADSVVELTTRLRHVFDDVLHSSFEIILVDDGSDMAQTWPTLTRLSQDDARIRAVRLMRNYGKPAAVLCGFNYVGGEWVITIDDDLQQRPEDIPALVAQRDHDVVVASYQDGQTHRYQGWYTALGSRIKGRFDAKVLRLPFRMTPLKLIKRSVIDQALRMRAGRPYIPALLANVTSDFKAVPLEHCPSKVSRSRYNFVRRVRQFSNLIISHSGFFARIWAFLGLSIGLCGLLVGAGTVLAALLGAQGALIGYVILATLLILGGMILTALGIVGEYLIRLVELTSKRPAYAVREVISQPPQDDDR